MGNNFSFVLSFTKTIESLKWYLFYSTCFFLTVTEKKFNCQVCLESYSSNKSLNQLKTIYDESKSFKCDICLKVFQSKVHLKAHYRTHSWEKQFAFQVSDRKFAKKSRLVRHQATHSEVRSFKCSIYPEGRYFKTKIT